MKILKKLTSLAVLCILAASMVLPLSVHAAGSATIAFSKSNPSVGDTVTVTIRVSAANMYGINVTGTYNEEVLTYVSGASNGGAGVFQIADSESFNGESSKSFSLTFKATKSGSSNISVNGQVASGIPSVDEDVAASATLSVKDLTLSSNANLKSLSLSEGSLSPTFSANTTDYKVSVNKSVTQCIIYAAAAESGATVAISGSSELEIGENKRTVTVTAPSGNRKVYSITIVRSEVDEEFTGNLATVIEGASFAVLNDISAVTLPDGFNVSKTVYNGEDVSVAADTNEEFVIYYLKSAESGEVAPYLYDEENNSFEKLVIITQMSKSYIVAKLPSEYTVPTDFKATTVEIDGVELECYTKDSEGYEDMYFLYCYHDGEYTTYRYDAAEKILQRSAEYQYGEALIEEAVAEETKSFSDRFAELSSNAKLIVVGALIVMVGFVALIILLIVRFIKRSRLADFDIEDYMEDFDSIQIDDNFEITADDE